MAMSHYLHVHLSKKAELGALERIVSVAAVLYPLTGLFQVIAVFQGKTQGVSVGSWAGFCIFSLIFLAYGVVHKLRPIIVTQMLWLVVNLLVVVGVLIHE